MNSPSKRLFIGMPIYNGERFVAKALESLLAQNDGDFELMISDNASTDGSWEICRQYAARDRRISVFRQSTTLMAQDHFLFLLEQARAPYFMWAACDDEWHPDFTRALVAEHERKPEIVLAFSRWIRMDENGNRFGELHSPDYQGPTLTARIRRLCMQWDDACIYGIFRRSAIEGLEFPVWWWVNRAVPMRSAYPPLCYILAKGDYALVGDEPMWLNRSHNSKAYKENAFNDALRKRGAALLRDFQMQAECFRQIQRATGAWRPAMSASPAIAARLGYDTSRSVVRILSAGMRERVK